MQPNPKMLLETAGITLPLIGMYDAKDIAPFEPTVSPKEGRWACVFMYFSRWQKGETLHITQNNFGCGGAGTYMFDQTTRTRESYIDFLYGDEGLKADKTLMAAWIDGTNHYRPKNGNLFLGPLKEGQYDHLVTVTFFANPDQLSLLLTGAHYRHAPRDKPAVIAPFASGCGLRCSTISTHHRRP
jgi:hypothetical protein